MRIALSGTQARVALEVDVRAVSFREVHVRNDFEDDNAGDAGYDPPNSNRDMALFLRL